MPVSAINNVFTKANNVGFTSLKSNKDKNNIKQESRSSSAFMKAVPLAAVLAMSPLTTANLSAAERIDNPAHNIELVELNGVEEANQNRKIVATKVFPSRADGYSSVKVRLVNTTGGAGFDKAELVFADRNGVEYDDGEFAAYVSEIATYNFAIISDDGVNQGTMPLNVVYAKSPMVSGRPVDYAHDELFNYLKEQLAKNPKKNVIPVNTYNRKLGPTLGGGLQNNPKKLTIDKAQGLVINASDYVKTAQPRIVQGENDKYKLYFYKSKADGRSLVTCEKASCPGKQFRVAMVGDFAAYILKNDHSPSIATYPLTILRNDNDGFGLMDSVLANELKKIKASPLGSNAFICPAYEYEYMMAGKGVLANITE